MDDVTQHIVSKHLRERAAEIDREVHDVLTKYTDVHHQKGETRMGKTAPWADIPDTTLVPDDAYEFTVKELAEGMSKGSETAKPKLTYTAQLKLTQPKAFAGMVVFDRFTVGTDDDPEAEDPETWKASFGARRLKAFCCAAIGCDVKDAKKYLGKDMDETIERVEGKQAIAMIEVQAERPDGKGGQYPKSNRVTNYYKLGAMEPGTGKKAGPGTPARPAAPKTTTTAKATEANGADTDAAPATTAKAKPAKADLTPCPICNEDVPRKQFIAHVQAHETPDADAAE